MSEPKDKSPIQHPTGDPNVDAAEQDIITNNEESNKIVNTDDALADLEGIESKVSESAPFTTLSADREVINSQAANGDDPVVN